MGASGGSEVSGQAWWGIHRCWGLQWTVRLQGRRGGAGGCWGPSVDSKVSGHVWVGWGMLGSFRGQ